MKKAVLVCIMAASPWLAQAGVCRVPGFDRFAAVPPSAGATLAIDLSPIASIKVPAGFGRIGVMPHGSISLGQHPAGLTAVVLFETADSVAPHGAGAQPGPFFRSIFLGETAQACEYLAAFDLEGQDYRVHTEMRAGVDLYAFGKGGEHRFYLVRSDKPALVLNGLFRMSRKEFDAVLSSLTIK